MKKLFGELGVGIVIVLCVMAIALSIEGCHYTTRNLGGEMTVELEPGQKLEEITWKEDSLWILSRPIREGETAETHKFYEDSEWGVLEGTITVVEKEAVTSTAAVRQEYTGRAKKKPDTDGTVATRLK